MTNDDIKAFSVSWSAMAKMLPPRQEMTPEETLIAFRCLEDYPAEAVQAAIQKRLKTPDAWMPSPGDIIGMIEPKTDYTATQLYGYAVDGQTALGVWVRYLATEFTILRMTQRQAVEHIESLMPKIEDFINRLSSGDLTNDQARVMMNYDIDLDSLPDPVKPLGIEHIHPEECERQLLVEQSAPIHPKVKALVSGVAGRIQ